MKNIAIVEMVIIILHLITIRRHFMRTIEKTMNTQNNLQKRIIKALAASPAAALRELIRKSNDAEEIAYIKRVAEALNIKIGD